MIGSGYVPTWVQRYPENAEELVERTHQTLQALVSQLPGNLLVVGHAASVCALALIDETVKSVECPLCALFCLDYDGSRFRLSLDSEVSHVGERLATYRFPSP